MHCTDIYISVTELTILSLGQEGAGKDDTATYNIQPPYKKKDMNQGNIYSSIKGIIPDKFGSDRFRSKCRLDAEFSYILKQELTLSYIPDELYLIWQEMEPYKKPSSYLKQLSH